ncbi:MAG: type II toxin-antitoxin system HicB family antitoxin [Ruminococcus sp.]|nr:type II toxin-antitoxin system HicB family antitoxin [Ruminococcus sp.]
MKATFPIILTPDKDGYVVYIPDFDINTQGSDLTEAIEMARDAIGLMGIDMEDDNLSIPSPTNIKDITLNDSETASLVDVDFAEYRRKNDIKTVKKNCTLPSWLCYEAEKANINFSQVLQNALKGELKIPK